MKAHFEIEYGTSWGENLVLSAGNRKYPMSYNPGNIWSVDIDKFSADMLLNYTYEVVRNGITVRQEFRNHCRKADKGCTEFRDSWIDAPQGCCFNREHSTAMFDKPGFRAAGTAVPVFSLRTNDDFGVGEFSDLRKLVDWAVYTGQRIVQILPINDTTMSGSWEDSYPYNANSTFALHPQYINLPAAGVPVTPEYKKMQAELNSLPQLDYEKVNKIKTKLLRESFAQNGRMTMESESYKCFFEENKTWLVPYAVFSALRDSFETPDFNQWGDYARYSQKKSLEYYKSHQGEVDYYCFVQYHLDRQLKEAVAYAHSKNVVFKGDLPIGISRTSVEAWCHPELFKMDSQAGAPPDAFTDQGQNWGFPTYNWEVMAKDNYSWWKSRLRKMAEYFDAFRIDHILGFFRIWEIPVPEKSGLMGHFSPALPYSSEELKKMGLPNSLFVKDPHKRGYWHPMIAAKKTEAYKKLKHDKKTRFDFMYEDFFYHRHNEFWKEQAMKKLPELLASTGMMACGEDLGMIPGCVPEVMASQKILSLEIQRWPKGFGETFANPANYPYLSVCTTSTHDMSPIRSWWVEEDRELIQRFYSEMLGMEGNAPVDCEPEICEEIVRQHLQSPAMLTILPLQDWLSINGDIRAKDIAMERINNPAVPHFYWRYRMHLKLEDLIGNYFLNDKINKMVEATGRKN